MTLLRSAALVGLAAAASRIAGFARDVMIAATLGAGPVADAFIVAFRLPTLARRVLGEGGIEAALVPIHARIEAEEGREAARRFAGEAFAVLCLAALALVAVVEAAAGAVVLLLAAGYAGDPGMLDLATWLTRLAFPMVAASLAAAFLGAV
ncbi:MAG TPA: lipid II flippase MurJ, partial [Salinarimonas sp.]|nr:lipid II flippase MurJ [Salinarimonas sp.]